MFKKSYIMLSLLLVSGFGLFAEADNASKENQAVSKKELSNKLFDAIALGNVDDVRELIDAGADLNQKYMNSLTMPIFSLTQSQLHKEASIEIFELLLKNGAPRSMEYMNPQTNQLVKVSLKSQIDDTITAFENMIETYKKASSILNDLEKEEVQEEKTDN